MARDDADLHPREYPEPDRDDDGEDTVPCPACRKPIYDDTLSCPHCGHYLTDEDAAGKKPWWVIVALLLCLAMAVGWALMGW